MLQKQSPDAQGAEASMSIGPDAKPNSANRLPLSRQMAAFVRLGLIPFPDTMVAQARRELNHCRTQRAFDRWTERATRYRQLACADRTAISRHAVARLAAIRTEGY